MGAAASAVMPAKAPVTCLVNTLSVFPGFTLFKNLANADDRHYVVFESGMQLLVHGLVGLGEVLTALGMADESMCTTDGLKLTDRSFARVCAFFGEVDVLGADRDV